MSGVHNTALFLPAEVVCLAYLSAAPFDALRTDRPSFETARKYRASSGRTGDSPAGFLRMNGGWPSRSGVTVLRDGAKIPRLLWTNGLSIGACYFTREGDFCLPNEREMCTIQ